MSQVDQRHFASIDELLEWAERDVVADQLRKSLPLHAKYEYLWSAEGILMPSPCSPFVSPFLYRGQISRHRPCVASVFRKLSPGAGKGSGWAGLTNRDRAALFVDRVHLEEFVLALLDHPASGYAKEIGLRLNPIGLAQHYEMATDRLDLSMDHSVAAFFATNRFSDGAWVPVTEHEAREPGVVYRIRTRALDEIRPKRLECLGKQSLPRPDEQKAFALTLPLASDFELFPVEVLTFDQVGSRSRQLNDRFSGTASLFPPDVMADVANSIRSEGSISMSVAEWILSQEDPCRRYLGDGLTDWKAFVESHSDVRVSSRDRISLSASELDQATASVNKLRLTFLDNVGAIAVRTAAV